MPRCLSSCRVRDAIGEMPLYQKQAVQTETEASVGRFGTDGLNGYSSSGGGAEIGFPGPMIEFRG